jgi:hypothetical protein
MKSHQTVETRAWTATICFRDGRVITTTIYGPNASEAERRAMTDQAVSHVIVRNERTT